MKLRVPFVLASRSPRRRRLLEQVGFEFDIQISDVEEVGPPGMSPDELAAHLAAKKALDISRRNPEALTLGADTIVVLDGHMLGKPETAEEAIAMLGRLSGRTHVVFTGIALVHPSSGRSSQAAEATRVTFADMDPREIASYVSTGSPMDKAGAYGIQDDRGALFVSRIEGDYYNVVGLPLHRLYRTLKTDYADLLEDELG